MLVGRFWVIIPAMAIAGSLAEKKSIPPSAGTFPTTGGLFVGLVIGVILIIGGPTFFPAPALRPIVEHLPVTTRPFYFSIWFWGGHLHAVVKSNKQHPRSAVMSLS